MRIILAVRLSRDRPETTSVDTQLAGLRAYATRGNHTIVAECVDVEESGEKPIRQRPEVGAWLVPERLPLWDAVVGYSTDRMFRDLYDQVTFWHDFLEPNGKLYDFATEPVDLSKPDSHMMVSVRVIMAQNELDKIKERNKRAAKAVLEQGYWKGGPVRFGFKPKKEGEHWTLVLHPENAAIIQDIADGIIEGLPVSAAARELTTRRIPTGRSRKDPATGKKVPITTWHATTLISMLRNPALAGYITYQYKFTKGKGDRTFKLVRGPDGKPLRREPAILDEETFAKLQRALKRPAQKRGRVLGIARLIRIAYCGECKQPLWSTKFTTKGKPYAYYVCSIQCGAKKIPQDDLHQRVDEMVSAIGHLPNKTPKLIPGKNHDAEIEEIEAQYHQLDLDSADYESERSRLLAERARLKALPVELDRVETAEDGRTVFDAYADDKRAWLLKHEWKIWARKDADGQLLVTGGGGELFTDMGVSFDDERMTASLRSPA